jgi:hypothetical protein
LEQPLRRLSLPDYRKNEKFKKLNIQKIWGQKIVIIRIFDKRITFRKLHIVTMETVIIHLCMRKNSRTIKT